MTVTNYFFIAITGLVGLIFLFRAINLFFDEKLLTPRLFRFPTDKYSKIGYCLCVVTIAVVAIYYRINK